MDIVKKNLFSIICGVIALAAVVAIYIYPLDGYYDELNAKAKKSAANKAKIDALFRKPRTVPNPNPRNPNASESLTQFPSTGDNGVIAAGQTARNEIDRQAKAIYAAAVKLNERGQADLAVPGSLPKPLTDTLALRFREMLQARLDELRASMGAGVPPTDQDIKVRQGEIWSVLEKNIRQVNGQPTNLESVMAQYAKAASTVEDQLKTEYAQKIKVYVDPNTVLAVPQTIPTDIQPKPEAMWWAQVEFWIGQDVVKTVNAMNAKSRNVLESPVKMIRTFRVPPSFFPEAAAGAAAAQPGAEGGDAAASAEPGAEPDPTVALPDGSSQSPTKRVSNPLFDVSQFDLVIDIEADQVSAFMKQLATNRFITVLNVELVGVDPQAMAQARFLYGPRPVVTLTLRCEALLLRHWTVDYMPDPIRALLKAPAKTWKKPDLKVPPKGGAPQNQTAQAR